jgi:2-dehydro-3-deoxyphosphogluconate aldolase/(4S)-4-hydroxy-2-oxoglutarate aldolase
LAGTVAVGLGSPLFGDALRDGDLEALGQRAKRLAMAVRVAREGRPV